MGRATGRVAKYAVLFVALFALAGADASGVEVPDALGVLREFGFPIFVSLWFMWRVEKRMDRFTESIQNLLTAVTIMAKTVDHIHDYKPHHGASKED